jgi:hypothetical protein
MFTIMTMSETSVANIIKVLVVFQLGGGWQIGGPEALR